MHNYSLTIIVCTLELRMRVIILLYYLSVYLSGAHLSVYLPLNVV